MKHLHLLMAVLTIVLFVFSAYRIMTNQPKNRTLSIISHVVYTLAVGSGLMLLYRLWQVAGAQHWAIAKLILLIVAISSMIKASKKAGKPEAKTGIAVAFFALICIVGFAVIKPVLG